MKVLVSYLSSFYDPRKTMELIDKTNATAIHADLMDGSYVDNKNFEVYELPELFKGIRKPIEFHLMINNPSRYISLLSKFNPICIYIHDKTENDIISVLNSIKECDVVPGIAINPNEKLTQFESIYPYVDRVLLMGVYPGKGGQKFLIDTPKRLEKLKKYQEKYGFEIYIDGGINNETIKFVKEANGVVSGSFICKSKDYQEKIDELKKS